MARFLKSGHLAESSIQEMACDYIKLKGYGRYIVKIHNEGAGAANRGAQAIKAGLRPGASDVFIALPRHDKHGFWLEFKSHNGKLSPKQISFFADMEGQGYHTAVVYSFDEAKSVIDHYLSGK